MWYRIDTLGKQSFPVQPHSTLDGKIWTLNENDYTDQ